MRMLMSKGANVNAFKGEDETPLHAAARGGFHCLLRPLIEAGADLEAATNFFGWRPLSVAACCPSGHNGRRNEGTLGAIRELVALRADIGGRESMDGLTPLNEAVQSGYVRAVEVLLELGANISAKHRNNYQAIHFAALGGHLPIIKSLSTRPSD
jgi:ankyrin repeat protein